MPVYLIRAGDTEMVKIGWADRDAEARCNDLQCGHYEELRIIRIIEGPRSLEGWFHRFFNAQRVRREWFRFSPAMLTVTMEADATNTPRTIVEALGGSVKLAERLRVNRTAVSNWMKDGFPKSRMPDLLRIAQADGVEGVTLDVLLPMEAVYPERPAKPQEATAEQDAAVEQDAA